MATYLILNSIVLLAVVLLLWQPPKRPSRAWLFTLGVVLLLTMVFDNLLIALNMFTYAPDKILGISIGLAPIEDFMYALLAVILIPALWHRLGDKHV